MITDRKTWLWGAIGLGSFCLLMTVELVTESDEITIADAVADGLTLALTILAAVGCALLAGRIQSQHDEKQALLADLQLAFNEGRAWRRRTQKRFDGIRDAVDDQFLSWRMTVAEREIGLLILKGLSHKEIAILRGTSEATVRQQAQSIYRKADLPGKTAFSAYFLDDLLADDSPEIPPRYEALNSGRYNDFGAEVTRQ